MHLLDKTMSNKRTYAEVVAGNSEDTVEVMMPPPPPIPQSAVSRSLEAEITRNPTPAEAAQVNETPTAGTSSSDSTSMNQVRIVGNCCFTISRRMQSLWKRLVLEK